jgi:aerotaxis receptor
LPVYDNEWVLDDDQYLISRTDVDGNIVYANPAFVEVSGFTLQELIQSPHNIVRHPDMPPQAFADLWDTLRDGESWLGLVKNRRKDGGYYWVLANASPVLEHGQVVGYSSVRVKPTDAQIEQAESVYAGMLEGRARGWGLRQGRIVPTGLRRIPAMLAAPFTGGLRNRMMRNSLLSAVLLGAVGGVALNRLWAGLSRSEAIGSISLLAAFALAILVSGWRLYRSVALPVRDAVDIARQVAAGNLSTGNSVMADDEVGSLMFSLDVMRKSLIGIAQDVFHGIHGTSQASARIASGNEALAGRTDEQASSLQRTATAMQALTVTVSQNAESARRANALADSSVAVAERGGSAVGEVAHTMQGISESSKRISDFVNIIEGIAFQTNILALNAAVEAARAGESGKSFAVVAAEVRVLAQKSSQAAKEIKAVIDESVERVLEGSAQVELAGATMDEMVASVRGVTSMIGEIMLASEQQSSGIAEVDRAIAHIDSSTNENMSLVSELSGAVGDLGAQARNLYEAITVFRVENEAPRPRLLS